MNKIAILVLAVNAAFCDNVVHVMKPVYKYRYETEDVMKTAETSFPVHGYHVVEGGYYPAEDVGGGYGGGYEGGYKEGYGGGYKEGYGGYGGGIGGGGGYHGGGRGYGAKYTDVGHYGGGIGHGGYGGYGGGIGRGYGKYPVGYGGSGYGGHTGFGEGYGGGLEHHGYGGEEIEKGYFSKGKKNQEDGRYEKAFGKKGNQFNHGEDGYSKDQVAAKDVKGNSGYYNNAEGGKHAYEDERLYHGGQHFDKEGNICFSFIS